MFIGCASYADINYLRQHKSPISDSRVGVEVAYTYFDERLDLFDISSKLGESTKPNSASNTDLSFYLPVGDKYLFQISYENSKGSLERQVEPKELESELNGYGLGFGTSVGAHFGFDWTLQFDGKLREQEPLIIECVQFGGATLGGDCSEADFRLLDGDEFLATGEQRYLPVLNAQIEEMSFTGRLLGSKTFGERFLFSQQLEITRSRIDAATRSPLFQLESDFILDARYQNKTLRGLIEEIQDESPQEDPWIATNYSYTLGLGFGINPKLTGFVDAGFYYVQRSNYLSHHSRPDYQNNWMLNFQFWYALRANLLIKFKARATTNYLLGIDSIAYNRKSNRFFKHLYGDLQVGFVWAI